MDLHRVDWAALPAPEDDGGAAHLVGLAMPSAPLASTPLPSPHGGSVDLASQPGRIVVFAYPMTGRPDRSLPDGWDMIPGARGCTPQACAFADLAGALSAAGVSAVFGLSTQDAAYQAEAAERLHLSFALLSDDQHALSDALRLPVMDVAGMRLLKRLTLVIDEARIVKTFYPVFPPDRAATDVLDWISGR